MNNFLLNSINLNNVNYRDAYDDRGMDDYSRYDVTYDRYKGYDDRMDPPPRTMTPPPPTAEMVAYEVCCLYY